MKKILLPLLASAALFSACPRGGINAKLAPIHRGDTPDLRDLVNPTGESTAAAGQVGEPATLLLAAQDQAEHVRQDVEHVLGFLNDATDREPDLKGLTEEEQPFGIWNITDPNNGIVVHVIAVRRTEDRVRILVVAEKALPDGAGSESKPIMAGVFVKKGEGIGGGKFMVSFSNFSDMFGTVEEPGADGAMAFLFANVRADLHGRRVFYANVDDRKTVEADPKNFAADLVRLVGVGGRFRSIFATEMIPELEGLEAIGMRTAWLDGIGGRSDMVIATQANGGQLLAVAQECWDAAGLRTAYADTIGDNDATDPNEGDVSRCGDLDEDTVDDGVVRDGGDDTDEELDAALDEAGANDVDDDEAGDDSVPDTSNTDDSAPAAP